jgi:long-chain-fatty-acid--CoA ligase ACSBG
MADTKKEFMNGPDQLIPATSITTTVPEGAVVLRDMENTSDIPPMSCPTLLKQTAAAFPDKLALAVKRNGEWMNWTYKQYHADTRTIAKAFIKLGLEQHYAVGILGFNAPEWFIAQTGAIFAGGLSCGIYTTNTPSACKFIAENCRANILVVEDDKQLEKIMAIKSELPHLKAIVQYLGVPKHEGVLSWDELLQIGIKESDVMLNERQRRIAINQACGLIYTSGTTGTPKVHSRSW